MPEIFLLSHVNVYPGIYINISKMIEKTNRKMRQFFIARNELWRNKWKFNGIRFWFSFYWFEIWTGLHQEKNLDFSRHPSCPKNPIFTFKSIEMFHLNKCCMTHKTTRLGFAKRIFSSWLRCLVYLFPLSLIRKVSQQRKDGWLTDSSPVFNMKVLVMLPYWVKVIHHSMSINLETFLS